MMEWVDKLWEEMSALEPKAQVITTGEWIDYVTKVLLPELGDRRRDMVLELVDRSADSNATTVAAELGMRRSTVIRLIDEGRARRRHLIETAPVDLIEVPTVEQLP